MAGPPRPEFRLPNLQYKAGEILIDADSMMIAAGPFDFSLIPGAVGDSALYEYVYVPQTDAWVPAD
jgi:hypothetical protein